MQDLLDNGLFFAQNNVNSLELFLDSNKEYLATGGILLASPLTLAVGLDIAGALSRAETIYYLVRSKEKDLSEERPDRWNYDTNMHAFGGSEYYLGKKNRILNLTRNLPLTRFADYLISVLIKDRTYEGVPVIENIFVET